MPCRQTSRSACSASCRRRWSIRLKHSGAKSFDVQLRSSSGKLHLTIRDEGVGFDVEKVLGGNGLGLVSMRERVRFVNGTISIQSAANRGTTIQVDVPLPAQTVAPPSA